MKAEKRTLIICIVCPLLVGAIASALTREKMMNFSDVSQPALSPPAWVFPIVWIILYVLMGISSYIILNSEADKEERKQAFNVYLYQLFVNFLWPIFFFGLEWYFFSFIWLLFLWILVATMIKRFAEISKLAAVMNIPYLLWLTFAAYLNLGVWFLN